MSKAAGPLPTDSLSRVVDLLVEHRIKLDALEHVLKETNPPVHELYLGTIENLRAQKAAEVNQALTSTLESQPGESEMEHTISRISDPCAVEIRLPRNEEVSQATKGDDSVTWIGRVK
jgi:hypothetical protein